MSLGKQIVRLALNTPFLRVALAVSNYADSVLHYERRQALLTALLGISGTTQNLTLAVDCELEGKVTGSTLTCRRVLLAAGDSSSTLSVDEGKTWRTLST